MFSKYWKYKEESCKNYIDAVKLAIDNDDFFKIFKSNGCYREVLEHCPYEFGQIHYENIKRDNEYLLDYLNIFLTNDTIGDPITHDYEFSTCSPSTLQYIGVLSNLIKRFGTLDDLNIIEIGAGYGGQCKIIHDIFTPRKYSIIDLMDCMVLQKKYLSCFNINNVVFLHDVFVDDVDLVISNYCVNELNEKGQMIYYDNIISKVQRGYLSGHSPLCFLDDLKKYNEFQINHDVDELESNGSVETIKHYIISWGERCS